MQFFLKDAGVAKLQGAIGSNVVSSTGAYLLRETRVSLNQNTVEMILALGPTLDSIWNPGYINLQGFYLEIKSSVLLCFHQIFLALDGTKEESDDPRPH